MTDEKEKEKKELSKSKIKCVDCGKVVGVRPDVREQRVLKFGSEKELIANYICRECRKKASDEAKENKKEEKKGKK